MVTPKQTEKSKLYAGIAHVKYINVSTQLKAMKTKAQDEYSVQNQEFLNETLINPMHVFRILFQVSEFIVIKKKKTVSDKWQSNKE